MSQVLRCHHSSLMLHHTLNMCLSLQMFIFPIKTSSTRQILLSTLQSLHYTTLELLITPLQYGIPNSRLRYYLLAKLSPLKHTGVAATLKNDVLRHIPGQGNWVDPRASHTSINEDGLSLSDDSIHELRDYLNIEPVISEPHLHAVPEKVLRKWGRLFDIVLPSSRRTCCFTRGFVFLLILWGLNSWDSIRLYSTCGAGGLDSSRKRKPRCKGIYISEYQPSSKPHRRRRHLTCFFKPKADLTPKHSIY